MKKLSKSKQAKALMIVADWLGPQMGYEHRAPVGESAAYNGTGPALRPDFDWGSRPNPAIVLEGGPEDWAIRASFELADKFTEIGVFAEPYSTWALSLYPDE